MASDSENLEAIANNTQQTNSLLARVLSSQTQSPLVQAAKDPISPIETPNKSPSEAVSGSRSTSGSQKVEAASAASFGRQAGAILIGNATDSTAETVLNLRKFANTAGARTIGAAADAWSGVNVFEDAGMLAAQYQNQALTRRQSVISNSISQTQGQLSDPALLGAKLSDDVVASLYQRNRQIEQMKDDVGEQVRRVASSEENFGIKDLTDLLGKLDPGQIARDVSSMSGALVDIKQAVNNGG